MDGALAVAPGRSASPDCPQGPGSIPTPSAGRHRPSDELERTGSSEASYWTDSLDGAWHRCQAGLEDRFCPRGPGSIPTPSAITRWKATWRGATPVLNTGQISRRGIGFESYAFRAAARFVGNRGAMEGEVTRVVTPASNTGEGPRGSGFESPVFRDRIGM